jgi:hypothetical protein
MCAEVYTASIFLEKSLFLVQRFCVEKRRQALKTGRLGARVAMNSNALWRP